MLDATLLVLPDLKEACQWPVKMNPHFDEICKCQELLLYTVLIVHYLQCQNHQHGLIHLDSSAAQSASISYAPPHSYWPPTLSHMLAAKSCEFVAIL